MAVSMITNLKNNEDYNMIKRFLVSFFLGFILFYSLGCSEQLLSDSGPVLIDIAETPVAENDQPLVPTYTPEPVGVNGTVLVNNADIIFAWLSLNEQVDIIGADGKYYIARVNDSKVLIDKRLIRLEHDSSYETWSGYAAKNSTLYDNYFLEGTPKTTFNLNDAITVLDDFGFCYRIEASGISGYMKVSEISKNKFYSGGNNGGSDGGSGSDGGEIILPSFHGAGISFSRISMSFVPENEDVHFPTTGKTRADNVEAYLGFINRGDIIKVIEESSPLFKVIFNGQQGVIRASLVRLPSQEETAPWNGYTKKNAPYYNSYHYVSDDPVGQLGANTPVLVLCEINGCYLVDLEGAFWFIPTDQISPEKYNTNDNDNNSESWTEPAL